MPKRQSAEEQLVQAANAQAKTLKAREDGLFERAKELLFKHRHLRQLCVDFLNDCLKHERGELAEKKHVVKEDPNAWNGKYTKLNVTPVKILKRVLQLLNRVSFSDGNLRQRWCGSNSIREPPAEELRFIVEYLTDWPDGVIIPSAIREIAKFANHVQPVYMALGSLGMNLSLPIDWPSQGPWQLVDARPDGQVMLGCRHSALCGQMRPVGVCFEGPVVVDYPFSWSRAAIAATGGTGGRKQNKLCILVFPELSYILNGAKESVTLPVDSDMKTVVPEGDDEAGTCPGDATAAANGDACAGDNVRVGVDPEGPF